MGFWKWLFKIPRELIEAYRNADDYNIRAVKGVLACVGGVVFFSVGIVVLPFPINLTAISGFLGVFYMAYTLSESYGK